MNVVKISLANLKEKKLNSFLSALLLTLGIGMISLLLLLNKQLDEQFRRNIRGIDMVVGAKGSPLQLILSSIYQIDAPTGNVPLAEVDALRKNPFVKTVIPLSMGDSYQGFRIVGTTPKYIEHFQAKLAKGQIYNASMEVAIGSKVAAMSQLKIGDTFASSHGLDGAGEAHNDKKYKVTGIFETTGSVVDQLILTRLSSVWDVHAHGEEGAAKHEEHEEHDEAEAGRQVTSALIQFRNPMGLMTLPRQINENTSMQAALPSIEINRLFSLLGVGIETLRALALIIISIAGISVFISLYNSLKERKYEMALMLSMGATRTRLFLMLLLEGLMLAVIGYFSGIILSRVGLWLFSRAAEQDFHYSLRKFTILPEEIYLFFAALLIGFLASVLPSLGIYRLNISRTLAEE
ncbi:MULTISPECIES: FtsX-like permease family protein [unclassified Dyadobacter]|uniref:ABC transporter permease n=1 Tax=unclassified Dyadobacter TaxID=2625061 RepID=UPI001F32C6FD|nr:MULTISPECIES: FtsX-like permease family protein [unclassified Dyadobacter]MCE7073449.1 FtsX-like permease family protein [Dyadobacter sp. CY327]MCF2519948.1 FtsX-like permease family protein [Dyadobacter sp. CY351]